MLKKILIIVSALLAFVANLAVASPQLSANPWVEANDDKTVEAIYEKHRNRHGPMLYQDSEYVTIDRTSAYIQDDELPQKEEEGFLAKVKAKFKSEPKNAPLIPATEHNLQKLAEEKKNLQETQKEPSELNMNNLTKSLRLPKMPNININQMIRKFERASGIDFKEIGNQFK